jgi:hypothetical protein
LFKFWVFELFGCVKKNEFLNSKTVYTMFWIYVPPIILVAALTALAIVLGRKSSDLKKIRITHIEDEHLPEKSSWKDRFSSLGRMFLHLVEIILDAMKASFRKIEQVVAVWVAKLRAKRNGRKMDMSFPEEFESKEDAEKIIREIEKTEEISFGQPENDESVKYIGDDVVIRRKIVEPPVIIQKKEPMPEDKVREAALIYRIAENPRDIEAYREIGDYYMSIGNIKDAKESFKMVLKLRPRDLKAKSSLREIEMKMRLGS